MNVRDRCERLCVVRRDEGHLNVIFQKKNNFFVFFPFLCLNIGDYFDILLDLHKKAIEKLWIPAQSVYIDLAGIKGSCFYFSAFGRLKA